MVVVSAIYGLTLCAVAGVSGAAASVFGKLAGIKGVDQTTQITCYVLLLVVSVLETGWLACWWAGGHLCRRRLPLLAHAHLLLAADAPPNAAPCIAQPIWPTLLPSPFSAPTLPCQPCTTSAHRTLHLCCSAMR